MQKNSLIHLFLLFGIPFLFALFSACTLAEQLPSVVLMDTKIINRIAPSQIEVLLDSSNLLTYKDVTSSTLRQQFMSRTNKGLNFGMTTDTLWLRFSIKNNTSKQNWILLADNSHLERVELFFRTPNGELQYMPSGNKVPSAARPLSGHDVSFPLSIPQNYPLEIYARINTASSLFVPFKVLTLSQYLHQTRISSIIQSSIVGTMLLLLAIACFGLLKYSGKRMLAYSVMVFAQLTFVLTQNGLGTEYLWPDEIQLNTTIKLFFVFLLAPATLNYCCVTLDFRNYVPRLGPLMAALMALGIVGAISSYWMPGQFVFRNAIMLSALIATLLLVVIPYMWLRGNPEARTFFLTVLPLILSALLMLAYNFALFQDQSSHVILMYDLSFLFFLSLQLYQSLLPLIKRNSNNPGPTANHAMPKEISFPLLPTPAQISSK